MRTPSAGVRLVILDCDRTLWDHHNVSELQLPFVRVDADTVVDARGVPVRLRPGVRALLSALREQGILISIASWNQPEPVFAIFDQLDLTGFFVRPKVEPHPYKERTISALLAELAAEGIALRPEEVVFVDDRSRHLRRVRAAVGPLHTLQPGVDFADLPELLQRIGGRHQVP